MTDSISQKKINKKPTKTRLTWGAVVFVLGFLSPLLIPLVFSSDMSPAWKTSLSALLAFGIPELFMIIAAGIMGKSGFDYLKRIMLIYLKKYGPPDEVSKTRYRIGLIMFFIPIVTALLLPYLINVLAFLTENYLIISVSSDVLMVISLFVLGGDFWDKLRGLFNNNAKIVISSNN